MTDRPRVVMVSGTFPKMRCGVGSYVEQIAARLVRQDAIELHIITSADSAVSTEDTAGYQVHPLIGKWEPWHAGSILREILSLSPDIVHIQIPTAAYTSWRSWTLSVLARKLKRAAPQVRLIVMQHDLAIGRPQFRWRYRPVLLVADAVLVSNARDRQAVVDLGIPSDRIHLAPITALTPVRERTAQVRKECRKTWNIPEPALCVASFGFIHPGRHIDLIVRALGELRQRGREVCGLFLGGAADGAQGYLNRCRLLTGELGLTNRVIWTGYADDEQVADGLAAADVFVSLPDRGADMRNTSIHTALLAGLPVITCRNECYGVDDQIAELGCKEITELTVPVLVEAILNVSTGPSTAQARNAIAAELDPARVWMRHIQSHYRVYRL